jgi:alpha-D-xyloside xylohydrolase
MYNTQIRENEILFSQEGELIRLTPCGRNAIRFQAFPGGRVLDENYNLMPQEAEAEIIDHGHCVTMTCGDLTVTLGGGGWISYAYKGAPILADKAEHTYRGRKRVYVSRGDRAWQVDLNLTSRPDEKFFGMGHTCDNEFDLKGSVVDIKHVNAKTTIPYVYSSLGYGFLWNVPSVGRVEFGKHKTRWHSDCCQAIDYVVIGGSPAEACETLDDLTGHAPVMPHWATGFWQCRLRYQTQEELLGVYRRYRELGIPLSAIIVDFFHWTEQGDYKFDPRYWPDVKAMADEIHETGTKLVVSMWPTINEKSENYAHMVSHNMLVRTTRGSNRVFPFQGWQAEIDVANPATREFVWSKLKENYVDKGVDAFWFDVSEAEIDPEHFHNLITYRGSGEMTALMYPYDYAQLVYEGFRSMGREDIVTLIRGAYLGSQKFASLVWSGDIPSTFDSLRHQVKGGLNMAMCGIPWWNTDIGGFYGGDTQSDYFRELIVRWFQYGLFSPVMRLHGDRIRHYTPDGSIPLPSGDPNEIWSFGERNFEILKDILALRERLRPYIEEQMQIASERGWPVMRPMFFAYPEDEACWLAEDQYLFGGDILFAPILEQGATERTVYVPEGEWILTRDGTTYTKGYHTITAQLHEFIALVRKGAPVLEAFRA